VYRVNPTEIHGSALLFEEAAAMNKLLQGLKIGKKKEDKMGCCTSTDAVDCE